MSLPWKILAAGDQAVTVEFSDVIDDAVNAAVIALTEALRAARIDGIVELVPTYRSLTICYDPARLRAAELPALLTGLQGAVLAPADGRLWRLPVHYGQGDSDLASLAEAREMTPAHFIELHSSTRYRVYMIGFAPGYAYLGGLDPALHAPRRAVPRQRTDPGAVAIGGQQTSVSSVAMPSGWNIIGYTPVRLFDPRRTDPFLMRAGDWVEFCPVPAEEARRLTALADANRLIVEPV